MDNNDKRVLADDDLELVAGGTGMTGSDKLVLGTNSDDAQQTGRCGSCAVLLNDNHNGVFECPICGDQYDKDHNLIGNRNDENGTLAGMGSGKGMGRIVTKGLWA